MKDKLIILRGMLTSTDNSFLGPLSLPTATGSGVSGLTVEVEEVERTTIPSLIRRSDILAVAPVMPMKLIEPFDFNGQNLPANQNFSWGVQAVGADTSPYSGKGIIVAVLDTGIDAGHPAFEGVEIVEKDFTGEGKGDQNGHGTHCAGRFWPLKSNGSICYYKTGTILSNIIW